MDFIVLAPNPWRGLWRNRQQIFSRLAGPHRVLYVEPARASLADWRRGRVSLAELRRPAVVEQQPNLWLYRSPAWLPARGAGGAFDRASDALLAVHLRRALRRLGFLEQRPRVAGQQSIVDDQQAAPARPAGASVGDWHLAIDHRPVLWLYRPTHWRWAAAHLPHRLLVYHITDDYTAFTHLSDAQRQAVMQAERDLLAAADLTIVTAPRLLDLKRPYAKRIELVPNAVDYAAFQRGLADPPSPVTYHPPPALSVRLGYSGHVSSRLDLPLLRDLALARPAWQFCFAGSQDARGCEAELASLQALPNVHFVGLLPVAHVPDFIAACDVCLIPYRVNDETRAISSLKLYEYLAAGKPVVSARVPAAEEHSQVVSIAEATAGSWLGAIEAGLAGANEPAAAAARRQVAAANTWDTRVQAIEQLLARQVQLAGI